MRILLNVFFLLSSIGYFVYGQGFPGPVRINAPLDPLNATILLARPLGSNNNIGQVELGTYGNVAGSSKWLGLGSAPVPVGISVYGQRIQWNSNFAVFNLRQVTATQKDLAIQWGGTTANNRLRFEYATSSTSPAVSTYMQIESNGNVGIGGTPSATDKLFVNGRIRFGSAEYIEDIGAFQIGLNGDLIPASTFLSVGSTTTPWVNVFATNFVTPALASTAEASNVNQLEAGLNKVMKMNPVTFTSNQNKSETIHSGFIAEEMLEIMPEVIFDSSKQPLRTADGEEENAKAASEGVMGINYMEMIPVLVKAMQEQQVMISEQQATIDDLVKKMASLRTEKGGDASTPLVSPEQTGSVTPGSRLFQNYPNPSVDKTTIQYELPTDVDQAAIAIFDLNGKELRSYNLNKGGVGELELPSNILKPGTYVYKLKVDGVEIDSKRMVLLD